MPGCREGYATGEALASSRLYLTHLPVMLSRLYSGGVYAVVRRGSQNHTCHVRPLGTERVPLLDALGRVLAEDAVAPWDMPLWDNSAMDGYAVRAEDCGTIPRSLKVSGFLPAGAAPRGSAWNRGARSGS